jgi:anti-sigma B factor antagonist
MRIDYSQKGNTTIITPHGDIRINQGDVALRDAVRSQLDEGKRQIVIDMAGVNFMDSAGLGEVVGCHKSVSEKGGEIKLAALNPRINDLFTLTKLFLVFKIFDSVDEAVASFTS